MNYENTNYYIVLVHFVMRLGGKARNNKVHYIV